ncbi:MAG: hypothetical protein IT363_12380 [Methanoregulaceae archaeon]|nr:hypothetical protein [Methanoregulaceae archaeon]
MHKLVLTIIALVASAISSALPTVWSHYYDYARGGKLIRDASSNLYFVRSVPTSTGRSYVIEKFNAAGVKIWENTVWENGPLGLQFEIKQLAVTATDLYVLSQVRHEGGTGDANQSWIRRHPLNSGHTFGSYGIFYENFESMDLNESEVVVHGRKPETGESYISYSGLDLTAPNRVYLGPTEQAGVVKIDPSGLTYVATTHHDRLKISKCTRMGGLLQQTELNSTSHYGEDALALQIDPAANRAYVLMRGAYGPTDTDVMIYYVNLATLALAGTYSVSNTVTSEWEAELTLLPNAGVIASAVLSGQNQTRVIRRNTTGGLVWDKLFVVPFSNERHVHAIGPDGSFHIVSYHHNAPNVFYRFNASTGASMGQLTMSFQSFRPQDVFIDAAGNFFANFDTVNGAMIMRIQPAQLSFSANNLAGGVAANGIITLSEPSAVNQVWTVASSNASLVGVPATVTLTAGNTTASFPLTVGSVTAITSVSINVRHSGFISQQNLTLVPSMIQSLSISPNVVVGGVATTGTATLSGTAPAGGRLVNLTSNKTNVATVPATRTVAAGATAVTFPVTTFGVNTNQGVVITATTGTVSKTAFFAVNAPSLTSISLNPTTLRGGVTGSLTLNISGVAPLGGFSIVLFSGAPGMVFLPAAASVTAGLTSRTISVPTAAVTSTAAVTVFATRSGIYRTATLTVTP